MIRRGHYNVADLYRAERDSWYYYTYGFNFRCAPVPPCYYPRGLRTHLYPSAYAAYISGILINVVGFAGASEHVPIPLQIFR